MSKFLCPWVNLSLPGMSYDGICVELSVLYKPTCVCVYTICFTLHAQDWFCFTLYKQFLMQLLQSHRPEPELHVESQKDEPILHHVSPHSTGISCTHLVCFLFFTVTQFLAPWQTSTHVSKAIKFHPILCGCEVKACMTASGCLCKILFILHVFAFLH